MDKNKCVGCYNDFYNENNNLDVEECWHFKSAKLILRKEVSIHQVPPFGQRARQFPSCYRRPGYAYVEPGIMG